MQFSEVVGQNRVKQNLTRLIHQERVPHALLFTGNEGEGLLPMALAFAQMLQCEHPGETDSCQICPQCQKSEKLIHPDIHFTFPVIGAKALSSQFLDKFREQVLEDPYTTLLDWMRQLSEDNKQGNITKEECRDIIRRLSFTNFEGRYKIQIIWSAELLSKEGNTLLKLIEEPQENTVLILLAETPDLLLPTILSRCQIHKLERLTDAEIVSALQQEHPDVSGAEGIAYLADGNLAYARQLVQEQHRAVLSRILDWFRFCYTGNIASMLNWVDEMSEFSREEQKFLIQYSVHILRELQLYQLLPGREVRLQQAEREYIQRMSAHVGFEEVQDLCQELEENLYYLERNAHAKLLFLDLSLTMNRLMKRKAAV